MERVERVALRAQVDVSYRGRFIWSGKGPNHRNMGDHRVGPHWYKEGSESFEWMSRKSWTEFCGRDSRIVNQERWKHKGSLAYSWK